MCGKYNAFNTSHYSHSLNVLEKKRPAGENFLNLGGIMSLRSQIFVLSFILVSSLASFSAEARRNNNRGNNGGWNNGNQQEQQVSQDSGRADDSQLVQAVNNRRQLNFVEGGDLVVTKVLPDDTQGSEHQKWVVRLSSGKTLLAVYNLDMCERVPLQEGDHIAMGGQFIWTNQGGLLHWLHRDPRGHRPDGYVFLNGKYYCK